MCPAGRPNGVSLNSWELEKMEMLFRGGFSNKAIASVSNCSIQAVRSNRKKWEETDSLKSRRRHTGNLRLRPWMEEVGIFLCLCKTICQLTSLFCVQKIKLFLTRKPDSNQQDICDYLYQELDVKVSISTVSRHLKKMGWSNKKKRL